MLAITRAVSPSLVDCALTFLDREPIDYEKAALQHEEYESWLRRLGDEVISLQAEPDLPDSCFVEDTAVVVDELAVMTSPRLASRAREVASVAACLQTYRPLAAVEPPATLEGGDVFQVGRVLYVGISTRTNRAGADQLSEAMAPYGYEVRAVDVANCLHLTTACTPLGRDMLLANPAWVDVTQFDGLNVVAVDPDEPEAGNALGFGDTVLLPQSFPRTVRRLERAGFQVQTVDVSELQKAEAGLTCCSIRFRPDAVPGR